MTEPVYILGGWQSDFAQRATDLFSLLEAATRGALEETALDAESIEVAHIGNFAGELTCFQGQLGGVLATVDPAFASLPTGRHEAACASAASRCSARWPTSNRSATTSPSSSAPRSSATSAVPRPPSCSAAQAGRATRPPRAPACGHRSSPRWPTSTTAAGASGTSTSVASPSSTSRTPGATRTPRPAHGSSPTTPSATTTTSTRPSQGCSARWTAAASPTERRR